MPRRTIAVVVALAVAVAATGCSYTARVSIRQAGVPGRTVDIEEYRTVDGRTHRCAGTARLPVAHRPGSEVLEQQRFDACQAERRAIALEAGAMTDADQRAARFAAMPDCTVMEPGRWQAVVFTCVGAVEQVIPAAEVPTLGVGRTAVGRTLLYIGGITLVVAGALVYGGIMSSR